MKRIKLELTVGTLRMAIESGAPKNFDLLLTQDRFMVEANHLVFQVENATTVCYTNHNGCYKPEG